MKLQSKIILAFVIVIGALVVIPLLLTNFLLNKTSNQTNTIQEPPEFVEMNLETETMNLEEGYSLDRVMTWDLVNNEAGRSVDRYRFERAGNQKGTFTISFYDEEQYSSFEEVIETRYGDGFSEATEDFELNGLPARRVLSAFLDVGNTSDIIVQTSENNFVSLYATHTPEGESSAKILQEINTMQMSFKPIK